MVDDLIAGFLGVVGRIILGAFFLLPLWEKVADPEPVEGEVG
jgi:hypothetical protein